MFVKHWCVQLMRQLKKLNWLPTMETHWVKQLSLSKEMNLETGQQGKIQLERTTKKSYYIIINYLFQ